MTRDEHVYAIQNLINSGAQSDDNRFTNRLVYHFLKVARAKLIKEKADRASAIADDNYQSLCMPLIKTTFHDCDCIPNSECLILRSKYKIPKQLVPYMGSTLQVYYFDGRSIGRVSVPAASHISHSRITGNPVTFFYYNGYIYITGTLTLKAIMVYGVFEDVDNLETYTTCDDTGTETSTPCYNSDEDTFPIDGDLVLALYKIVIDILNIGKQMPEDNENNARSTTVVQDKEV